VLTRHAFPSCYNHSHQGMGKEMTTLLIVDDNAEMRQLVKSIASKVSDEIFECADGDEALAAFTRHQPDWVVMDVEMKRMDGLKATAEILTHYPQAKIIIVTKHTDTQTRAAANEAGARAFCSKDDLLSLRSLIEM
jgi:CheY-like chemotaxis protein